MAANAKKTGGKKSGAAALVVMGSDSDLKDLSPCLETLEEFGVSYEAYIASAHRTHDYLRKLVAKFDREGGKVVIAAAGGAAHLPGVVAALTALPVIGVPMGSKLLGLDSLLSIVQMPAGMPVACVAVNGAKNAGLLAVQMISTGDPVLRKKYEGFRKKQSEKVIEKSKKLKAKGFRKYFE